MFSLSATVSFLTVFYWFFGGGFWFHEAPVGLAAHEPPTPVRI
ncbi:hypothetical protein HMPREF0578_0590 [Mobiluncus mulieris 28-1]|nr:hypothetical protein HMPREF0578_0590 [Mobiluncus mulieris 28-1]EFN94190.1 hypothetical protein HMPREF9278_0685 [Mobiluncus mulieris FB024-16]